MYHKSLICFAAETRTLAATLASVRTTVAAAAADVRSQVSSQAGGSLSVVVVFIGHYWTVEEVFRSQALVPYMVYLVVFLLSFISITFLLC